MDIKFDDIETFVFVVQEQSFSKAAKRLRVAKSLVSKRVSELETKLSGQLLKRTTRSFGLTALGEEMFDKYREILDDLEDAKEFASSYSNSPKGLIKITVPTSFGSIYLAPLIAEFLNQNPDVKIHMHSDDRIIDITQEGYDLGIRISKSENSVLIGKKLGTIRHLVVASPEYLEKFGTPKVPRDLHDGHRTILYSNVDPKDYWKMVTKSKAQELDAYRLDSGLVMNNGCAMREAAIAGFGIAFLPSFIVSSAISRGALKILLQKFERSPINIYAVYSSKKNLPLKTRMFIDFLAKKISEDPAMERHLLG